MPPKTPNALLHGALDALILKTLAHGPLHGYAIARFIEETTGEALLVEEADEGQTRATIIISRPSRIYTVSSPARAVSLQVAAALP